MVNPQQITDALPKRWVVMGVSGSGKSAVGRALASRTGFDYVEGDDYHPRANIDKMSAGQPLTDADREGWLLQLRERLRQSRQDGTPLILTCSALKRRYRDLLRQADPDLAFLHLDGNRELIASRMRGRTGHFMPLALLDSQLRDLEPLQADEHGLRVEIVEPPEVLAERVLQHYRQP